jgi:hypothetical protein
MLFTRSKIQFEFFPTQFEFFPTEFDSSPRQVSASQRLRGKEETGGLQ